MDDGFADFLGRVFDDHRADLREALPREDYEKLRFDFVFHMTDWLGDLDRLHALRRAPESWSAEEGTEFLIGVFFHVIPHLKAAGRLLVGESSDPFAGDEADQILEKARRAEARAS